MFPIPTVGLSKTILYTSFPFIWSMISAEITFVACWTLSALTPVAENNAVPEYLIGAAFKPFATIFEIVTTFLWIDGVVMIPFNNVASVSCIS